MASTVYFTDLRSRSERDTNLIKIDRLFEASVIGDMIEKGDLTAIKVHFGEIGNDSFLSPIFIREIVERVKAAGATTLFGRHQHPLRRGAGETRSITSTLL